MKRFFRTHPRSIAALTAVLMLLLGVLTVLTYSLQQQGSSYIDMTTEGLYTPTEGMKQVVRGIKGQVTITFCDAADRLLSSSSTRYIYILAKQAASLNPSITVRAVDISQDLTAVYEYRATSASTIEKDDVIVACDGRYRIFAADSFYTIAEDGDTTRFWSFNGEYKLAMALLSVTSLERPKVYFSYSHGERYYVPETDTEHAALLEGSDGDMHAFYDLLLNSGLEVDYIDLDAVQAVPDDCVLLIMCGPKTDYTDSNPTSFSHICALDAIHNYLVNDSGAFMIFKDPEHALPELGELCEQWGIAFRDVVVRDSEQYAGDTSTLVTEYNRDENDMSYGVYTELADMPSPPRTLLQSCGAVSTAWSSYESATSSTRGVEAYYSPFLYSSPDALAYTTGGAVADSSPRAYQLSALTARIKTDPITTDAQYSYVFGCATTSFVSSDYLSGAAFGNYDVMFSLVRYISRTDVYPDMSLGGTSLSSENYGGKIIDYCDLYDTDQLKYENGEQVLYRGMSSAARTVYAVVLCLVLPTAALAVCFVITTKRKNK